jgi:hypothetical protein
MAGDIKDAGALAGIVRFGVPWHGRIEDGALYTGKLDGDGNEITRAWAQPATGDCWLVKKPGLDDPYAGEDGPARQAADAAEGRQYKNFALVSGLGNVHGKNIMSAGYRCAWIWFDPDGRAWAVSFKHHAGTVSGSKYKFSDPMTLRFLFSRFGDMKKQGSGHTQFTVDVVADPGDLGQSSPVFTEGNYGLLVLSDVNETGSQSIFSVSIESSSVESTLRLNTAPVGFVAFDLAMVAGVPSVSLTVLKTREETLGTLTYSGRRVGTQLSYENSICGATVVAMDHSRTVNVNANTLLSNRLVGCHFNSLGAVEYVKLNLSSQHVAVFAMALSRTTECNYGEAGSNVVAVSSCDDRWAGHAALSCEGREIAIDDEIICTFSGNKDVETPHTFDRNTTGYEPISLVFNYKTTYFTSESLIADYDSAITPPWGNNDDYGRYWLAKNTIIKRTPYASVADSEMLIQQMNEINYNTYGAYPAINLAPLYALLFRPLVNAYGVICKKDVTGEVEKVIGIVGPRASIGLASPVIYSPPQYASFNPETEDFIFPLSSRRNFT